jgi:hypothetical protein
MTAREIYNDILNVCGKRILTVADVKRYTGLVDYRTIKRRFSFDGTTISAWTLAKQLAGGIA